LSSNFESDRIDLINEFCNGLLSVYRIVIFVDVDEFIVVDPRLSVNVREYLLQKNFDFLAPVGLNVVTDGNSAAVSWAKPLLAQAGFLVREENFCKPAIRKIRGRVTVGGHALRDSGFDIDTNLFMFHLKYFDVGSLDRYAGLSKEIAKVEGIPFGFGQWMDGQRKFWEYFESSSILPLQDWGSFYIDAEELFVFRIEKSIVRYRVITKKTVPKRRYKIPSELKKVF
jgi:hypothetical protein